MKWLSSLAEPLGGIPSKRRVLVEGPAVQLVAGTEATEDRLLAMQKESKQG